MGTLLQKIACRSMFFRRAISRLWLIALPLGLAAACSLVACAPGMAGQSENPGTSAVIASGESISPVPEKNLPKSETAANDTITKDNEITAKESVMEKATFGAGCFWGVEAAFRQIKGVKATAVGYEGGHYENPTYKDVCTDKTGHAEVVQVEYDPSEISYDELLNVFWENHNPTTLNRQGPDVGTQYRSVVFYHTPEQKASAERSMNALQKSPAYQNRKIVTSIEPAQEFYRAEEYHQQYLEKRGLSKCHL